MQNFRLGRNKTLKTPRIIKNRSGAMDGTGDLFAVQQAFDLAQNKKFSPAPQLTELPDAELELISKIPESASDLIVLTKAKKLGAYVIAATAKSPAKFRSVFVARMQNYCLDTVEDLLSANFIKAEDETGKRRREEYQNHAIIKLKMLSYVAMVAENAGCILPRQYKQIALQTSDVINLTAAWKKSDNEKWRIKQENLKPKGF